MENEQEINEQCTNLKNILLTKNKMYGNSFFKTIDEYGQILICVRIEDKLNRLKQIILKGENDKQTDERLADTILDIAGYAILSKVYLSRKKQ